MGYKSGGIVNHKRKHHGHHQWRARRRNTCWRWQGENHRHISDSGGVRRRACGLRRGCLACGGRCACERQLAEAEAMPSFARLRLHGVAPYRLARRAHERAPIVMPLRDGPPILGRLNTAAVFRAASHLRTSKFRLLKQFDESSDVRSSGNSYKKSHVLDNHTYFQRKREHP